MDRPDEVDIGVFPRYGEPELLKAGSPGLRTHFTTQVSLAYESSWYTGGELVIKVTDAPCPMQLRRSIQGVGFRLERTDSLRKQVVRVVYRWTHVVAPTACGGPRPAAL